MVLNFDKLSEKQTEQLNLIAQNIKRNYISEVGKLAESQDSVLEWYSNSFACRNTLCCNVYEETAKVFFVIEVLKHEKISTIIVRNVGLKAVLKKIVNPETKIKCKWSLGQSALILSSYYLAKYICAMTLHYAFHYSAKFVAGDQSISRLHNDVNKYSVIETVLYKNSFAKDGSFSDRHFPFVDDLKKNNLLDKVILFPVVYGLFNFFKLYIDAKRSCIKFVFIQDVVGFFNCVSLPLFIKLKHKPYVKRFFINGVDLTELANHSLRRLRFKPSGLLAISKHLAIKRIEIIFNFSIAKVLRWNENHELDHLSVLGWKNYCVPPKVYGYLDSFPPENYLSIYPTIMDIKNRCYPDCMYVIGQYWIDELQDELMYAKFSLAKSYRFNYEFFTNLNISQNPNKCIFIPLPLTSSQALILNMLISAQPQLPDWRLIVRPHPADYSNYKYLSRYQNIVVDRDSNFNKLLISSNVVIGSASSALVQALQNSKYVIRVASLNMLSDNVIPKKMAGQNSIDIYNSADLVATLKRFEIKLSENMARLDTSYYIVDSSNGINIYECLQ